MEQKNSFPAQALNYNVILKEVEMKNVNDAGLDTSGIVDKNEKYKKGVILSIGSLIASELPNSLIEVGKEVIYDTYKSSDITIEGVLYKQVLYADLLLVL